MATGGSDAAGFVAVEPKRDCPHVQSLTSVSSLHVDLSKPCGTCSNVGENWLCLVCSSVFCSRYVNCHMVDHNSESGHPVVLSFSDVSVWCYGCDSYVASPLLQPIIKAAQLSKFGKWRDSSLLHKEQSMCSLWKPSSKLASYRCCFDIDRFYLAYSYLDMSYIYLFKSMMIQDSVTSVSFHK